MKSSNIKLGACVVRSSIAKTLLALAAKYDYEIEQMDVIIAFLEANIYKKRCGCSNPMDLNKRGQPRKF